MAAPAIGKSIRKEKRRWLIFGFYHSAVASNPKQNKIKFVQKTEQEPGGRQRAGGKEEKNACETGGNVL